MNEDTQLLRFFAASRDEAAFARLVDRNLSLVHSVALRRLNGDLHLAKDVAQIVFTDLARKAGDLADKESLAGWLFVSTRYAAAKLVRTEQRRRAREKEACTMNDEAGEAEQRVLWEQLRPLIDETLGRLGDKDRLAVLLRYFEGRSYSEIGEILDLNENSARMRTDRALGKLQALLARRGVTSSATALSAVLASQAVTAAPAGLAASVSSAALSAACTAAGLGGISLFMGMTKAQLSILGTVMTAGIGGIAWQQNANASLTDELGRLHGQVQLANAMQTQTSSTAQGTTTQVEDTSEISRLRQETETLRRQLQAVPQTKNKAGGQGGQGPVLSISELDVKPKAMFQAFPKYPDLERRAGVPGKAVLEFIIQPNGELSEVKALDASSESFGAAAVEAVRRWRFEPGRKGGAAVSVRMKVPIIFNISEDNAEPPRWF